MERKDAEMKQFKLEQERTTREREAERERYVLQGVKDTADMYKEIIKEMHENSKQKDLDIQEMMRTFNTQLHSTQQALEQLNRAPAAVGRNGGTAKKSRCGATTTKGTPCKNRAGSCPYHYR